MFIVLVSPFALYLTFLVLLAAVFGITRRTFYVSLLVFGLMLLVGALGVSNYLSYFIDASKADPKAQVQVLQAQALIRAGAWLQAAGWPALLLGFIAFKKSSSKR